MNGSVLFSSQDEYILLMLKYKMLEAFRPQRHLDGSSQQMLLPFGGGERVCLGKALAELELRLMTVGLLKRVRFSLVPGQDLDLQLIPSPSPKDGLLVSSEPR